MKMKNRVLAVLALALLMINMAPVRVAEAATELSLNAKKINYDTLPTYQELVDIIATYYDISEGVTADNTMLWSYDDGLAYYIFYGESLNNLKAEAFTSSTVGAGINAKPSVACIGYNANTGKHDYSTFSGAFTSYYSSSNEYKGYVWGAPITCVSGGVTIPTITKVTEYPKAEPDPIYSPDAPYLNDVVFGSINNFRLDGNTDFTQSFFQYTFELGNADSEFVSRKTKISGYVYLPSKEFIDKAKNYFWGGRKYLDEFYSIYSCEYFLTWLKDLDVGDGSTSKKWYFTTEFDCTDSTVLRLSNQEIYDLVEQTNGVVLKEYYDIHNDVQGLDDILKGYMWVHRLDGVVYTTYSDVVNYGNLTSFVCSNYLKDPVISIGNSDPLSYGPPVDFVGPMLPDADVHQSIEQAYKDALEEARKDYENNLELDGDSEGLFELFGSLSDGISDMSGSFRKIALAVGNVFAFFPGEITTVLYAGLIAMIVVAVYKAIRG